MISLTRHDLEERRRLSLALSMRADAPNVLLVLNKTVRELRTIVIAPQHERIIGSILFVLALLTTADVWTARDAASSALPQYSAPMPPDAKAMRVALAHPAISAAMISAASPF